MSQTLLVRRTLRGATALRGGRPWRPTPYQVFGFLFWLVMTLAYWRVPLCCDAGQHAAVVERLKSHLLRPRHPMADLPGAGSPYYSPYALAQGAFARLTGLGGWEVVKLAGPLNLLVLLTGLGRFVRVLTPRQWAPVLALAAMTLLWGTDRAWWSGYLGLMSMTGNLGYPSAFAIGLTFWAWALTGARARGGARGLAGQVGLGALYGLILLVHPITSVAAVLGAVALVAGWRRRWSAAAVGRWAATGAAALLVAVCWPYFDVFALAGNGSVDAMHRTLYLNLGGHFGLALLLGLPALWLRTRRRPDPDSGSGSGSGPGSWRDPLVLMFALDCLVVAYGWVSGHYTYGRILGLTLVPLQFALAVELAAPRPWPTWRKALAGAAAVGACAGFLTVQAGAVVPRSLDPVGFAQPPRWPTYEWAARHIGPGEVVITDGYYAVHAIAGYGPNLAAPAWPDSALDERERLRRVADVRAYLAPTSTRAERTAVARRHQVRWLLLTRWHPVPEEAVVVAWSERTGEVLARVG
ncbi:integral membrane protein [Streptomyces lincolnensis]|uniref:Integral membrane protein n=1 Tax=Streptomyces lincolnensis TaxID=1915 RepID=A0A1B1MAG6_STRLN|nr:hypothetical protein [Streptomyces lincolnensis]ANS65618.1 integral membrane protein [Streptomyces lincolnensis]AXG54618.1 integral membrane protein [Streptomyces lincolnensis]QMV08976.1 hypothetical protein GJU35_27270 [Streptomyces lincolnensis]